MSSKIRILSDLTINKIAAGEVIENPASVVKELMENAVDAGATRIVLEVKGGGLGLIRVSDDGQGMSADDAVLSLERHATSKIRDDNDLFDIVTMGFRGEALASIAAVSKLTLTTSLGKEGTKVEVAGGTTMKVESAARARGTTIEVASLFYNVPARKKFQKSASVCSAEITRVVTLISLANPHITFEVIQQDKRTLMIAAEAQKEGALNRRAKTVLGPDFDDEAFAVSYKEGAIQIEGILGAPSKSRPNRRGHYFFINGRSVQSPALAFAVKDGYGTRLEEHRFPTCVLHIQMPPGLIDVNVHPQKKEIRFKDEAAIKMMLRQAVIRSLNPVVKQPSISFETLSFSETYTPRPATQQTLAFREEIKEPEAAQGNLVLKLFRPKGIGLHKNYLLLEARSIAETMHLEAEDGIVFVDLQAAHARILFEQAQSPDCIESQTLLIPITLSLSMSEMESVRAQEPILKQLGFELREAGPKSYLVESCPPELSPEEVKEFIIEGVVEISEKQYKKERALSAYCARLAKRKQIVVLQEALYLFEELLKTQAPLHCPQGKPTLTQMRDHDIINSFTPKTSAGAPTPV